MSNSFSSAGERSQVQPMVRLLQVISFGMVMGTCVFGGIVLFATGGVLRGEPSVITWMAVGLSGLMIVNHFTIPRLIAGGFIRQLCQNDLSDQPEDEKIRRLLGAYQTSHIVGFAMLEGAAFFSLVACLLESTQYAFGAAVILLALMLVRFPTAGRINFWIEDRLRELSFH